VLEYDGTGTVLRRYTHGRGIDEVLNLVNADGSRAILVPDIQGSLIASVDTRTGTITRQGVQAYGESADASGSFRYTGRRIDAETLGLYYYRARMYSPTLGRFMQRDPIGYAGGANLYGYVGNDPLNATDSLGLCEDAQSCGGAQFAQTGPTASDSGNTASGGFSIFGTTFVFSSDLGNDAHQVLLNLALAQGPQWFGNVGIAPDGTRFGSGRFLSSLWPGRPDLGNTNIKQLWELKAQGEEMKALAQVYDYSISTAQGLFGPPLYRPATNAPNFFSGNT
jgi:RHS repeat-associated protein